MRTAVAVLGKIGPPLAVQYVGKGHEIIGVDVNPVVVEAVNAGAEPFPGKARLAEKFVALSLATGNDALCAATGYAEATPEVDAIMLVVLLFVNDATWEPSFAWMDDATRSLAAHLTPNTLISHEITLPVGTLRGRFKPMIEEINGLKEETDFRLVFSPERVLTGRVFVDLRRYPKLVGGLDEAGTQAGITFYESVLNFDEHDGLSRPNGVWDIGTAEVAEMAKLVETTYRNVNIDLANQFAVYTDKAGFDVEYVIEVCNSQPYSHIHRPGIAVGGHCTPVYLRLYLSTDPDAFMVRTACTFNVTIPTYAVGRATEVLGSLKGLRIVVLGASYRGKVKETVSSGVFPTVEAPREAGVEVLIHDPTHADEELADFGWTPHHLGEQVDAVIVQVDHPEYGELSAADLPGLRFLLDGRRATGAVKWTGVPCLTIGRGE